jgi:hypothetical protein
MQLLAALSEYSGITSAVEGVGSALDTIGDASNFSTVGDYLDAKNEASGGNNVTNIGAGSSTQAKPGGSGLFSGKFSNMFSSPAIPSTGAQATPKIINRLSPPSSNNNEDFIKMMNSFTRTNRR